MGFTRVDIRKLLFCLNHLVTWNENGMLCCGLRWKFCCRGFGEEYSLEVGNGEV
jgi:hypothetical protein